MQKSSNSLREAVDQLRDPVRMRLALLLAAMAIAYLGIYSPLNGAIEDSVQSLKRSQHNELVNQDVQQLEEQAATFEPMLVQFQEINDIYKHFTNGVALLNKHPAVAASGTTLSITSWDRGQKPEALGPYQGHLVDLTVTGPPQGLDLLLQWLDENAWLLRVESFKLAPSQNGDKPPSLRLKVLAVKEKA